MMMVVLYFALFLNFCFIIRCNYLLKKSIKAFDNEWTPHRAAIVAVRTTPSRPTIKTEDYNKLDEFYKTTRKHFSYLSVSASTPPLIGIMGTLIPIFQSDLADIISLQASFQDALLTTIFGLLIALFGNFYLALREPVYEHRLKEFESIMETVFREGAPLEEK